MAQHILHKEKETRLPAKNKIKITFTLSKIEITHSHTRQGLMIAQPITFTSIDEITHSHTSQGLMIAHPITFTSINEITYSHT